MSVAATSASQGTIRPLTLTKRETEVLDLLARGITTDKELCKHLVISPNTVKYHITNLLSKLGLKSRAELMPYALQHGLIEMDEPSVMPTTPRIIAFPTCKERPPRATKPTVLVMDDDEDILVMTQMLLELEGGYEVKTCRLDGQAYDHVRTLMPDLVILDLLDSHRQETGWRALELLYLDPQTHHIPVILCSGASDRLTGHSEWTHKLGVEVLHKPFDIDELLGKVHDLLASRPAVSAAVAGSLTSSGQYSA